MSRYSTSRRVPCCSSFTRNSALPVSAPTLRLIRRALGYRRSASGRLAVQVSRMRFIRRLVSRLERNGVRRRPEQTLREFAAEAVRTLRLPPEALAPLIDLSYRVRWGREVPTGEEFRNAELQVARLGQVLRG